MLEGTMLCRPVIMALKGDSYTTPADAVTAGSRKPASAMLGTSKKKCNRAERWYVFTQESGLLSLWMFAIVAETESKPGLHINYPFIRKEIKQSRRENKI